MNKIAEGTHVCGDPGVQYDSTINRWHTCANSGRINASNPCSEYMFLDNSACNLASLNLMKFVDDNGTFDVTVTDGLGGRTTQKLNLNTTPPGDGNGWLRPYKEW